MYLLILYASLNLNDDCLKAASVWLPHLVESWRGSRLAFLHYGSQWVNLALAAQAAGGPTSNLKVYHTHTHTDLQSVHTGALFNFNFSKCSAVVASFHPQGPPNRFRCSDPMTVYATVLRNPFII